MHDQLTLVCIRNHRSTLMFIFIVVVITIHYYEITDWNPKTIAKNTSSSIHLHSFICILVFINLAINFIAVATKFRSPLPHSVPLLPLVVAARAILRWVCKCRHIPFGCQILVRKCSSNFHVIPLWVRPAVHPPRQCLMVVLRLWRAAPSAPYHPHTRPHSDATAWNYCVSMEASRCRSHLHFRQMWPQFDVHCCCSCCCARSHGHCYRCCCCPRQHYCHWCRGNRCDSWKDPQTCRLHPPPPSRWHCVHQRNCCVCASTNWHRLSEWNWRACASKKFARVGPDLSGICRSRQQNVC